MPATDCTFSVVNQDSGRVARWPKVSCSVEREDESGFLSPNTLTDVFPFMLPVLPAPKFGGSRAHCCLYFSPVVLNHTL